MIDGEYAPIDWQLDFISGYRWDNNQASGSILYGHKPGVDVKVPWELSRLQHLPQLALATFNAESGKEGFENLKIYAREFRNQVLDFIAMNPPRYGVNWACTMDVAIRAANLCLSFDLFKSSGTEFDEDFLREFEASLRSHGNHITTHLEWHEEHRANHYLADIAGLVFVAAYLPSNPKTDCWLAFAVRQLIKEVKRQFTEDGANFEASTSYHRLSAEMVIYATALVLGLSDQKKEALQQYDASLWKATPAIEKAPIPLHPIPGAREKTSPFPDWYFQRLERMAEFTMQATKPNGLVAQIGDNDSGRFFKVCPLFTDVNEDMQEIHLDHHGLVSAINGLFNRDDFANFAGPDVVFESDLIGAFSGGTIVKSYLDKNGKPASVGRALSRLEDLFLPETQQEKIITPPDPAVLSSLTTISYPDFGLFIWRSDRFFLSIRCGPIGQNGNGGHAHNDQLAVELNIDGENWIADPGTFVYTPDPTQRDLYRSVKSHAVPHWQDQEPAKLNLGLFRLEDRAKAKCIEFGENFFHGIHYGYGFPIHRTITLETEKIVVRDAPWDGHGESQVLIQSAEQAQSFFREQAPFSPGYGMHEPDPTYQLPRNG